MSLSPRARQRCVVYSSITHRDIDLSRAKGFGPRAFKTYLEYAETGLFDTGMPTGRDFESDFEEEVAKDLSKEGYRIDTQVGVAGFRIDLAVIDDEYPGQYLLGIECDGRTYHSSRSARDRDRLREAVLVDKGWIIHRIWSTDWFQRPQEELKRVISAIESAKNRKRSEQTGKQVVEDSPQKTHFNGIARDCGSPKGCGQADSGLSVPYEEALFHFDLPFELHEIADESMARMIKDIVDLEGPIHQDEIAKRITYLAGLARTGSRIMETVKRGLKHAVHGKMVEVKGNFYKGVSKEVAVVRNREGVRSSSLRKPAMLPPDEIKLALQRIVESYVGVSPDEAILETARLLGFKSTSAQIRKRISSQVTALLKARFLSYTDGMLYAVPTELQERETPG